MTRIAGRVLVAGLVSLPLLAGMACRDLTGPAAPARLGFAVQPIYVLAGPGQHVVVRVVVQDAQGRTVATATNAITVALTFGTGTPGATLSGSRTVAAAAGVADFADLTIDRLGAGYTLTASASGLAAATSAPFPVRPAAITVAPSTPDPIAVGTSMQFTAQALDVAAGVIADPGFTWRSGDTTVLRISASGLATAVGVGYATITASVADMSRSATLTTFELPASVEVTPSAATLVGVSAPLQLTAIARNAGGAPMAGQSFAWSSGDPSRVRVSSSGIVKAVGAGSATITATALGVAGGTTVTVLRVAAPAVRFEMGSFASWALTPDGAAYGWGQLQWDNITAVDHTSPAALLGGLLFRSVSAGGSSACGITGMGGAYCWGGNVYGELGDGTRAAHHDPAVVSGGLTLQSISVGDHHACGVTLAGTAYCWGYNGYGQLGDGTNSDRLVPSPVTGGVTFQSVAAGSLHTCGLTPSGTAYCWGRNANGQLGDGTTTDHPSPVPVAGGLTFRALSLGASHTCGVTDGGSAYCWGANPFGQLGDSTLTDRSSPVAVAGGLAFGSVTLGIRSTCALATNGAAYCWGGSPLWIDQLQLVPAPVPGGFLFQTLSAGGYHACGLTTDGAAYCWGYNTDGQVGDGTTDSRPWPVPVTNRIVFGTTGSRDRP